MLQINSISDLVCVIVFLVLVVEVHGTENPLTKRPAIDVPFRGLAITHLVNDLKKKMKTNQLDESLPPKEPRVRAKHSTFTE